MAATPKTDGRMGVCVGPQWTPLANTSAACYAMCASHLACAGWILTSDNRCNFCSYESTWSSSGPYEWTTPRGCSADHQCLACPQNPDIIDEFASYRLGNASLLLSKSCNYYQPANPNEDMFSASSPTRIIELYDHNVIKGPGSLLNPISIIRPNARVENVRLPNSHITVRATGATLVDITSMNEAAAVAYNANIDGLNCSNIAGTSTSLGLAHVSGDVVIGTCPADYSYILQESFGKQGSVSVTFPSTSDSCAILPDVNLTRLLAVFGTEYETRYFHDGQYTLHTASTSSLLYFFINVGLFVLVFIVYVIVYKYPITVMHRAYRPVMKASY